MRFFLRFFIGLLIITGSPSASNGQEWVRNLHDEHMGFDQVRSTFRDHTADKDHTRSKGIKPFERIAWFQEGRHSSSGRIDLDAFQTAWQELKERPRAATAKSANWTSLGPASWTSTSYNPGNGRVNCIAVDPTDSATIYVGTPSGGLWKSTDDGQSWQALFDDMPSLGITSIVVHPNDPNIIFAATGDGFGGDTYSIGVVKSTDGGQTWITTGLDWSTHQVRTTRKLIIDPVDPLRMFCAANNGLWRTTDGALSWERVVEGSFNDVELKPNDPTVVYACTTEFLRSSDGGSTFSVILPGLPASALVQRMLIGVTPGDPDMVYALCGRSDNSGYKGIYRSTNAGMSFSVRSTSPNIFGYQQNGSDNGGQCWYDMALAVDPLDPDIVYAGGVNVWKSTDGGTGWAVRSYWFWPATNWGYTHADIHALELIGGRLYCGSDGGLYRREVNGSTWVDLSAGLEITQCYRLGVDPANVGRLITGSQDNGTILFEGTDRTHVQGSDGMEAIVDPIDDQILYGCIQNGAIYRSTDGGAGFTPIANAITEESGWVAPYVLDPQDPLTIIAGYKNLWVSHDRGDNWSQMTNYGVTVPVVAIAIAPSDPNVIFFCNKAWMRRTTNGGATWTNADIGLPPHDVTAIAIDPADPAKIIVTMGGFIANEKVFMSSDTGTTWTNLSAGLPNVPVNTVVLAGTNTACYAGTDLGVFYRDDQLSTWQPFLDGLPYVVVTELEFDAAENQLYAATYGRGIWVSPAYTPSLDPPTANFTHTTPELCAGSTIRFSDLSLNAAPGWEWQFPGGQPAVSTDASPEVTYAATGTYNVTLTMNNAFGQDAITIPVAVDLFTASLQVDLLFDDYPQESSWTIATDPGGTIVAQGGPYIGSQTNGAISVQVCLPPDCYRFIMHDSYGDGMCCDAGTGAYTLSHFDLGILAFGGDFTAEESTAFCVDLNVGITEVASSVAFRTLDGEGLYAIDARALPAGTAYSVTDVVGRVVRTGTTSDTEELLIDLRPYSSGVFMLQCSGRSLRLLRP